MIEYTLEEINRVTKHWYYTTCGVDSMDEIWPELDELRVMFPDSMYMVTLKRSRDEEEPNQSGDGSLGYSR
jgi:hypothetical protein